jgi:acetyl-CoA synthetase
VFAPWLAGATICIFNYSRFDPVGLLNALRSAKVTSFCAPPTVWRLLIQQDLGGWQLSLRELASAGEPLNPEVIDQVAKAWGITIRDGFGLTETTLMIGNPPGQPIKIGSMGRPMPGFEIDLIDPVSGELTDEGEICVRLSPSGSDDLISERPVGLLVGYLGNAERNDEAFAGGRYHTGDVASRDTDGYITYVGRTDDVFKSSDYRISPFELESVLLEHPSVAEAAVVPSPDDVRLVVPKAFVALVAGVTPDAALAADILDYCREHVAPYKRIRRIEFVTDLPKTTSGKIRRVEMRKSEADRGGIRSAGEFREEDFA